MNYQGKFMQAAVVADIQANEETKAKYMFFSGALAQKEFTQQDQLNAYQAEYVVKILAEDITALHEELQEMKSYTRFCWKRSEVGYVAGEEYFLELNRARNRIIKIKRKIRVLEDIQKKLKNISKAQ